MINLQKNIALSDFSNFKIGGVADYFVEVKSEQEIIETLSKWRELSKQFPADKENVFVLGGGTNLVISDDGFRGLVIRNSISFIKHQDNVLSVGAGTLVEDLVNFCLENNLSGFEWAGGLPGTVGGAIRGNAGAFGGETKDNVLEVESLNVKTLNQSKRNRDECAFGYRMSIFKKGMGEDEIITSVTFSVLPGDHQQIIDKTKYGIEYRQRRHPLELPNTGSIFKNTPLELVPQETQAEFKENIKNDPFPVLPSAKLISYADLVGLQVGGARVSEKHPNFIVNMGGATAENVKELIEVVKSKVHEKYGVSLEEEVVYI